MSRTVFVGLALIGLAACGGGDKKPATARTATHAAAAHRTKTKSKAPPSKTRRKTAAARDTSSQRNPLTNH